MTKLPVVSGNECVKALIRAGFDIDRQKGSHVILYKDNPKARAVVPNHKTIKKGTLRQIITDSGLTIEDFLKCL
ncbi:MAG: type II toxin-antitoxin system HicA family toxin [Deltaproteobacteria bacterium]|nr:type II toxin-antitoxin system HicA family toxin [Deltaproteobacteria bacterium]